MNLFYVQADGDTFVRHIHDIEPTRWDENNFCRVAALTPEQKEKFGVHQLKLVTPPYYDPATQNREQGPAVLVDGVWTQTYNITYLEPEIVDEKTALEWAAIRAERNKRLADTDWTQLPDAPTNARVWAEYRQALRDVPQQSNPFDVAWPKGLRI